jgi:hypothetical protein
MPFKAFLHPLWQIGIFILGIYTSQMAMKKKSGAKAFALQRHLILGWIFLILIALGAVLGKSINNSLVARNIHLKMSAHGPLGFIIIILVALGIGFGHLGLTDRRKYESLIKWHPYLNIMALGLLTAQALLGILALLGI